MFWFFLYLMGFLPVCVVLVSPQPSCACHVCICSLLAKLWLLPVAKESRKRRICENSVLMVTRSLWTSGLNLNLWVGENVPIKDLLRRTDGPPFLQTLRHVRTHLHIWELEHCQISVNGKPFFCLKHNWHTVTDLFPESCLLLSEFWAPPTQTTFSQIERKRRRETSSLYKVDQN